MIVRKLDQPAGYFEFKCPKCGRFIIIDKEQATGKKPIFHDKRKPGQAELLKKEKCNYHKQKKWL